MTVLKIENENGAIDILPNFSLTINDSQITSIQSDVDIQVELVKMLKQKDNVIVFDRQDGLYERLTIEENISFYHKWFNCQMSLPDVLVMFKLQNCAKKKLKKCSASEIRRVFYAKQLMMSTNRPVVFVEPTNGVDVLTINTFIQMLEVLTKNNNPVLTLVTNLEHAILLGDIAYRLQDKGLHEIELETKQSEPIENPPSVPLIANLYKIPAKVDEKVILFDPLEIDYIESQDGKAKIVINNESFTLDSTLTEIEKKLEVYGFFRCHRSYIVNLQKVREIITWSKNTYSLKIDNQSQSTIPLSRTKLQDIQDIFNLK